MAERAKQRSAFCSRKGLFQQTRMLFVLTNAPSTFCHLMETIFHYLLYVICICYLDDINIFVATLAELIDHQDRVFTRLREHGLKAKPSKCVFFKNSIKFLGHLVPADKIESQPERVDKIENCQILHCLTKFRAFIGLVSYYRRFIKNFAKIAKPLTRLMQSKPKQLI